MNGTQRRIERLRALANRLEVVDVLFQLHPQLVSFNELCRACQCGERRDEFGQALAALIAKGSVVKYGPKETYKLRGARFRLADAMRDSLSVLYDGTVDFSTDDEDAE